MTWIWQASYFLSTFFTISDTLQVIKSLLMSSRVESGVIDEWDSAGLLQDSFENHFIDMFLNVTHIKYITCTHSFKAALIAFLITTWLNWPRHCMHIVYFALWYEMIQATVCAGTFVRAIDSTVQFPCSFEFAPAAEVKWSTRLKCLPFDVIVKTFFDWINARLVKRKSDRNSSFEWGGQT